MKFLVQFAEPVLYQAGHWSARLIPHLVVHAPDARGAEVHALRVCSGPITITAIDPYTAPGGIPPLPEELRDVPETVSCL